ncbi:MAG: hypothetical protein JWP35_1941 [Caulobacter sp.]|nr:hypothetical protein [Caulobacter sp.]
MTRTALVSGCAFLALALAAAAPAFAEAAAAAGAPSADTPPALEEVVVTARRQSESLQQVPLAVTAFSPKDLAAKHIESRTDLANFTPSLITITGGYPSEFSYFALRGQGPAFGSVPGVIPYFAEVPNAISVDGRAGTLFDMASVQVVAGPQGTLFGKNATGGNVLFVPQRPTNEFGGYVQVEGGNYNDRRAEFALNIPLVDGKALLRVGGEFGRRDGYTIDVGPNFAGKDYDDVNYDSVRASLILRPTDNIENYTIARYFRSSSNGPGTILKQFNPAAGAGVFPALVAFPGLATAVADQAALGNRHVAYDLDEFSKTTYWQFINQTTVDFNDHLKLKNIVSYSHLQYHYGYDYDATIFPIGGQTSAGTDPTQAPDIFTEELQLQGRAFSDALSFTVGGYYDRQTLNAPHQGGLFTQFPLSFFLGPIPATLDNRAHSYAVFGQGTLDLEKLGAPHGLSLTLGLRHTWDYSYSATAILAPPVIGEVDFDYTSYNITLDYQPSPGLHLYATSRDAFKAGGVNGPVPVGSPFRDFPPEKLQDIELGVKSQFEVQGMPVRLGVAVYRGDYTNIQRTTGELVSGVVLNVTRSAAKGLIQGVEINTAIVPVHGLTLTAGYSYIDSKYTKVDGPSAALILNGSAFPYTPANKVSLGASYSWPLGALGQGNVAVNYAYQSKFSTAQTNQAQVKYLPGYGTLNLRAGIDGLLGRPIDLSAFVTNANDSEYATGIQDQYIASGSVTYTYGEPRMYGVQLRYHF